MDGKLLWAWQGSQVREMNMHSCIAGSFLRLNQSERKEDGLGLVGLQSEQAGPDAVTGSRVRGWYLVLSWWRGGRK